MTFWRDSRLVLQHAELTKSSRRIRRTRTFDFNRSKYSLSRFLIVEMIERKHLEWLPAIIFAGFCIAVASYLWLTGQFLPESENINAFYINTILIAVIAIYAIIVILQLRATYKKILKEKRNA